MTITRGSRSLAITVAVASFLATQPALAGPGEAAPKEAQYSEAAEIHDRQEIMQSLMEKITQMFKIMQGWSSQTSAGPLKRV